MSPGLWLHHAALAWRQAFDRPPTQQKWPITPVLTR
jgi:hypothetical protein